MAEPVRISDISLYLRCPRLVYFQAMGRRVWPEAASPSNLLMREVALSLSEFEPEGGADLEAFLRESLERAKFELPTIFRDEINPADLLAAAEEIGEVLGDFALKLSPNLGLLSPSEVEVELRSHRLGLSGRVDRVVSGGGEGRDGGQGSDPIDDKDRPPS